MSNKNIEDPMWNEYLKKTNIEDEDLQMLNNNRISQDVSVKSHLEDERQKYMR